MRMNAGTIGASARPQVFGLWAALVAGIAVTALILSVVAVRLAVRTDHQAAPAAKEAATVSPLAVTGTGPGLIDVAERSVRNAAQARIYSGEPVTGTGPGLAHFAFGSSVPQITGTGPGLVQVAKRSQAG